MVLLAASICTKSGKALVSRQFMEMTRTRIEGLLAAFPKLISTEKNQAQRQHTFVETESVRYVYQPMDNLYMVLITTRNSNILEDLETLRLFSRVIPEYCRANEEKDILEHAFELIFAFDEIVALGYRESVNLAQIRTFTEMDSHEERVFNQIKIAQERAANETMVQRAKELKLARNEKLKTGMGGRGGISSTMPTMGMDEPISKPVSRPQTATATTGGSTGKAMKLAAKTADEDQFIRQLKSEGQHVTEQKNKPSGMASSTQAASFPSMVKQPVHIRSEEKLTTTVTRDGGVQSFEIAGIVTLRISDAQLNAISILIEQGEDNGAQFQVHPHLDRTAWQNKQQLRLKNATKPFPINNDVGVLKWRLQSTDDALLPLSINCWPSETADGCTVNIEYTLQATHLQLKNVVITIPLPPSTTPVVSECEGSYQYVKGQSRLLWNLMNIDAENANGTLEFHTPTGHTDNFFPLHVSFVSEQLFCNIKVTDVVKMDSGDSVTFSSESALVTERFDIV